MRASFGLYAALYHWLPKAKLVCRLVLRPPTATTNKAQHNSQTTSAKLYSNAAGLSHRTCRRVFRGDASDSAFQRFETYMSMLTLLCYVSWSMLLLLLLLVVVGVVFVVVAVVVAERQQREKS